MLNKSSKLPQYRSIFLIILFATSLLFTSYIQNSKAQVQENEETAYLKFASQTVKDSSNSSSSKNSASTTNTTAATQIPETAKGPPIPAAKGYLVQEIRNHLYWVTDGSYNTMFLVTEKGVVAVDAPPSIGKNYLKAISEVTDKPITYVIYSHAHLDHIGAAGIFPKNATFIAQQETAAELQRAKSVAKNVSMVPPIPTVNFYQELHIADWKSIPKVRLLWR